MKRFIVFGFLGIACVLSFIFTMPTYATAMFTTSKANIEVGEEFTINLAISDVAAWNIHIEATGAVENCSLNEVDVTEDALNTTKNFTKICKAKEAGEIMISLRGDYTTEDGVTESLASSLKVIASERKEQKENDNPSETEGSNNEDKNEKDDKDKSKEEAEEDKKEDIDGGPIGENSGDSAPNTGFPTKEDDYLRVSNIVYLASAVIILIISAFIVVRYRAKRKKD